MGEAEVLSMVEMRRAALMLWAFAVVARSPEVMRRCVLESWRTLSRRKQWPVSVQVDVREIDGEKGMPLVSNSKETTASFACVEALGVNMPPTLGWVPKPGKDAAEDDGGGSPTAEWWIHLETKEWIYHKTDDMYYHLPSGGLWERREAESMDPKAERYTYYRVDAPHLQMLQQFAKSLDSSLLPMAFKGWVRFIKKKKEKDRAAQREKEEREAAEAASGSPGASMQLGLAEPQGDGAQGDGRQVMMPAGNRGSLVEVPIMGRGAASMISAVAESDLAAGPSSILLATGVPAGTLAEREGYGGILPSKNQTVKDATEGDPLLGGSESKRGKSSEKKRGFLVCLCGRSGRRRTAGGGSDSCAKTPQADTAGGAGGAGGASKGERGPSIDKTDGGKASPKPARKPSKERTVDQVIYSKMDAPAPIEALRPNLDTVDRHMRRLEQFMQEVKRNPQRLVDHIERRRADKTTLAFMLF